MFDDSAFNGKKEKEKEKKEREKGYSSLTRHVIPEDTRKCHEFDVVNDENFVTRNYVGFRIFQVFFFFFIYTYFHGSEGILIYKGGVNKGWRSAMELKIGARGFGIRGD